MRCDKFQVLRNSESLLLEVTILLPELDYSAGGILLAREIETGILLITETC